LEERLLEILLFLIFYQYYPEPLINLFGRLLGSEEEKQINPIEKIKRTRIIKKRKRATVTSPTTATATAAATITSTTAATAAATTINSTTTAAAAHCSEREND
jgi:hypothetical protein